MKWYDVIFYYQLAFRNVSSSGVTAGRSDVSRSLAGGGGKRSPSGAMSHRTGEAQEGT